MVASIWVGVNAELTAPATSGEMVSAGLAVTTGTPAEATLMVNACVTRPAVVVAEMVTGKLPLRVGVPVICPVPALKLNPVGSVPDRA